ncbi:hypothetical protein EG68_00425 [Paragonimus skrjabini miyazakii]|uniref:Uncharacterized protein n=1 Tax=Paragonimus skrjabini miyazakii TaxID=59628 RepID=A0A8S9ZCN1_9TREM|nr:hypothetical protein EG68_00425 [Paragonimus skrjabini miyazakii]
MIDDSELFKLSLMVTHYDTVSLAIRITNAEITLKQEKFLSETAPSFVRIFYPLHSSGPTGPSCMDEAVNILTESRNRLG